MVWFFKRETWKLAWVSMRRAHRDNRARRYLLRLFLISTFYVAFITLELGAFISTSLGERGHFDPSGLIQVTSMLLGAGAIYWFRARSQKHDDVSLKLTTYAAASSTDLSLVKLLQRETRALAFFLDRLASERLMEKELPPQIVVITRSRQMENLRKLDLWDDLRPQMRTLLLSPDGAWSHEQKNHAERGWELLRALRWALLCDAEIRSLGDEPKYSVSDASEMARPEFAWKKSDTQPPWEIRAQRNLADRYFGRLWTEALARNLLSHSMDAEQLKELQEDHRSIAEDAASTDILIGARTVLELPDHEVMGALIRALDRYTMLDAVLAVVSGEATLEKVEEVLDSRLFESAADGVPKDVVE